MSRVHLTEKAAKAYVPRGTTYRVHDDTERALALEVRPSGEKRWLYRRQRRGRQVQIDIGRYPSISVVEAREAAHELARAHDRAEAMPGTAPTLRAAWTTYERRHFPKLSERTQNDYRDRWWPNLAPLAGRPLDAITNAEIARLHANLADVSPITANRTVALLSSVYGRARTWGIYVGPNPCQGVIRAPEVCRQRFLDRGEVSRLLAALDAERPVIRDYFRVLLMTGARRNEVLAMRWDEIHDGLWVHRQKGGGEVTLPLAPQVAAILAGRPRLNEYVFPGRWGKGHMVSINSAWRRVRVAAGLTDVRPHDLRHTLGSWQAMAGASLQVIGASLGHSRTQTTERYAHLQLAQVRASVNAAVDAMLEKETA